MPELNRSVGEWWDCLYGQQDVSSQQRLKASAKKSRRTPEVSRKLRSCLSSTPKRRRGQTSGMEAPATESKVLTFGVKVRAVEFMRESKVGEWTEIDEDKLPAKESDSCDKDEETETTR